MAMVEFDELKEYPADLELTMQVYETADKRLSDVLQTKSSIDQKALSLFGGYLVVALAMLAAAGTTGVVTEPLRLGLLVGGLGFVAGASHFVWALTARDYGVAGTNPEVWLTPEVLSKGANAITTVLMEEAWRMQKRIKVSIASNNRGHDLIQRGIVLGLSAPVLGVVAAVCAARA